MGTKLKRYMFVFFLLVAAVLPLHAQHPDKLLQTFSMKEVFGISHPNQIVDFDFAQKINPGSTYMIGPDGVEVPYQLLRNGKIAVQTDLPANARRTWKLYTGKAPTITKGGVQVTITKTYHEITN